MSVLVDLIRGAKRPPSTHDWEPGQRKHTPVLLCRRLGCPVVWWPERWEPLGECTGKHLISETPTPRRWGFAGPVSSGESPRDGGRRDRCTEAGQ